MATDLERYISTKLAPALRGHDKPKVLLLTCMDYRYAHRIVDLMDREGLRRKYDIFILAGAALGGNAGEGNVHKVPAAWREALVTHIRAARAINHPIERILILEHRDCGAYKHFLELDWSKVKPQEEFDKHRDQVVKLDQFLKSEFAAEIPNLQVDSLLLAREEDDEIPV